jgi:hypothetical protein
MMCYAPWLDWAVYLLREVLEGGVLARAGICILYFLFAPSPIALTARAQSAARVLLLLCKGKSCSWQQQQSY